jgi:elongation factor G
VVGDDELLERYLDGHVPTLAQLEATLASGVLRATVFPVVCGSALSGIGVERLADFLCEIGPSPLARPVRVRAGDTQVEVEPAAGGETLAHVFKTISDPYVGRISLLKVDSGTIHPDDHLVNSRTGGNARMHGLTTLRGRAHEAAGTVPAGDLAAAAKLADTATGDTLATPGSPVHVLHHPLPEPVYAVAVVAASAADEDRLAGALHRLLEEDPTLQVTRDDETHQTLLAGAGETHLAVALDRIQQRFGVSIATEEVRVPYRETVSATATAEGRYKKQTGGHGQFGVVTLRIEPRPPGTGFEFIDEIIGGAIPRPFIAAVQRGVEEAMAEGGLLGYPVVDVAVACVDGHHHRVDSSEMSFKLAARLAFRQAQAAAEPVLLEPISKLHIVVPSSMQGDVLSDLGARRGQVQNTAPLDAHHHLIEAMMPRVEAQRYAIGLRTVSGGRGTFHLEHDHYDVMPAQALAQLRRAETETEAEAEAG